MQKYIDAIALGSLTATLVGLLPNIAALFTIAWYGYKFWKEWYYSKQSE